MNSNRFLRILLGGSLLLLLAVGLHRWLSKRTAPPEAVTTVEAEAPATAAQPRPGARVQPGARRVSGRAPAQPSPLLPQKLYVEWKGRWYPAEILSSMGGSNFIHYTGHGSNWDEWVTAERMRYSAEDLQASTPDPGQAPAVRMTLEPGDAVAFHGSRWWRAEVLAAAGEQRLIRYVGYGEEWDEWVGPDRFKVYSEADAKNDAGMTSVFVPEVPLAPERITTFELPMDPSPLVQGSPAQGELLVQWGNKWWPAEILKQEGNNYFIRYKNYGEQWDEWVTKERIGVYSAEAQ